MMVRSTPNPGEVNAGLGGFHFTDPVPAVTEPEPRDIQVPRRRTSFNFLRRGKSTERMKSSRTVSGGKLTKRQSVSAREQEMAQQQREAALLASLELPAIPHAPSMQSFCGDDGRPDSIAIISNKVDDYTPPRQLPNGAVDMTKSNIPLKIPIPPIPGNTNVDPYASAESMTNRGRYSYASSMVSTINNPRRVRRRKDPTPFKYVSGVQMSNYPDVKIASLLSEPATLVKHLSSSSFVPPLLNRCESNGHSPSAKMTYHNIFIPASLRASLPGILRQN